MRAGYCGHIFLVLIDMPVKAAQLPDCAHKYIQHPVATCLGEGCIMRIFVRVIFAILDYDPPLIFVNDLVVVPYIIYKFRSLWIRIL